MATTTIGPETTLTGHSLKQALESIYAILASVLRREDDPDFYRTVIPEMVLETAVGAGWVDFVEEVPFKANVQELPDWIRQHLQALEYRGQGAAASRVFSSNEAQRLVKFGEFYMDREILKSFLDLLAETIGFHLAGTNLREERLRSLSAATSPAERQTLLAAYVSKHGVNGNAVRMTDIAKAAGVDYSVLAKWKKGKLADSATPAQRISLLLKFDEASRARRYMKLNRQ